VVVKPTVSQFNTELSAEGCFERMCLEDHAFFLDSGMDPNNLGGYSFLGMCPFLIMKSRGTTVRLTYNDGQSRCFNAHPFDVLRDLLDTYRCDDSLTEIPFSGGAVGYLSYDLGRLIEKLPGTSDDDLELPECYLAFYDSIIVFDHLQGKQFFVSVGEAGLNRLKQAISCPPVLGDACQVNSNAKNLKSNFSHEEYLKAVERTREHILAGDIFQANISQRFETPLTIPPYELYRSLRRINPAPFAAYLNFDEVTVISSSPERFLRLDGNQIQTRPIKGTRPRGKTNLEDRCLAQNLLTSDKDRAENIMIVDLERNDLGRVSIYGSVRVTELAVLESYATVHHLASCVEGILNPGKDRLDLLRATFPGGSITGAPKVRAMEIIEELEPTRRSVYTGSIGYFGFDGGMDLNIAIRTIIVKKGKAYFQVGGGIVFDSDPEAEYRETLDKARALMEALGLSYEKQIEAGI
jgi:para-aminobenzoate synthetase component 1